jgi:hypothetical protein
MTSPSLNDSIPTDTVNDATVHIAQEESTSPLTLPATHPDSVSIVSDPSILKPEIVSEQVTPEKMLCGMIAATFLQGGKGDSSQLDAAIASGWPDDDIGGKPWLIGKSLEIIAKAGLEPENFWFLVTKVTSGKPTAAIIRNAFLKYGGKASTETFLPHCIIMLGEGKPLELIDSFAAKLAKNLQVNTVLLTTNILKTATLRGFLNQVWIESWVTVAIQEINRGRQEKEEIRQANAQYLSTSLAGIKGELANAEVFTRLLTELRSYAGESWESCLASLTSTEVWQKLEQANRQFNDLKSNREGKQPTGSNTEETNGAKWSDSTLGAIPVTKDILLRMPPQVADGVRIFVNFLRGIQTELEQGRKQLRDTKVAAHHSVELVKKYKGSIDSLLTSVKAQAEDLLQRQNSTLRQPSQNDDMQFQTSIISECRNLQVELKENIHRFVDMLNSNSLSAVLNDALQLRDMSGDLQSDVVPSTLVNEKNSLNQTEVVKPAGSPSKDALDALPLSVAQSVRLFAGFVMSLQADALQFKASWELLREESLDLRAKVPELQSKLTEAVNQANLMSQGLIELEELKETSILAETEINKLRCQIDALKNEHAKEIQRQQAGTLRASNDAVYKDRTNLSKECGIYIGSLTNSLAKISQIDEMKSVLRNWTTLREILISHLDIKD